MKSATTSKTISVPPSLKPAEKKLLAELEDRVQTSMMDFCKALAEIRDYKDGIFWSQYTSFQEYARNRFGYGEQHTGRLVAAGGFLLDLESSKSTAPRPLRESQVRPLLNKIPKSRQVPCWELITEKTEPSKLTAEVIEAEVIKYRNNIPEEELKANKRTRKPKRKSVSASQKAKDKSLKWIERLNVSTANLPNSTAVRDLLDKLRELIGKEK